MGGKKKPRCAEYPSSHVSLCQHLDHYQTLAALHREGRRFSRQLKAKTHFLRRCRRSLSHSHILSYAVNLLFTVSEGLPRCSTSSSELIPCCKLRKKQKQPCHILSPRSGVISSRVLTTSSLDNRFKYQTADKWLQLFFFHRALQL